MNKFEIVTAEWIKRRLEEKNMTNREFGKGVNVNDSQVSKWLSGYRNPSGAAKAAIYYFFCGQ